MGKKGPIDISLILLITHHPLLITFPAMYSTLISPAELASLQSAVVIDCRFELAPNNARINAGRDAYAVGHIPGALYAHLDSDLSGPITETSGRHPLPDPVVLATTLGKWGISSTSQVVVYDADTGMYASRLWWLLRWLGHHKVAVLDGGFKAWQNAGLPISASVPTPQAVAFTGRPNAEFVVTATAVAKLAAQSDWRILDARAPERFRGDIEPIDTVAGHIPGARNHPFAWNIDGNNRLLAADKLAQKLHQSLDGVASDHSVMMCGSGVTACHNLLAMEIAGLSGAKLYAGSWSEWIRDQTRAVATGNL
jgi:thiosulfate/3-mercaptopyruvate sulfurtransferase